MNILDYFKIDQNILIPGIPILTSVYILSLELGKGMGNVWYRTMENGKRAFLPSAIPQFFTSPFKNLYLWYPETWSLNPYIFVYVYLKIIDIIYKLTKKDLNK